jgi:hypothetical protein
LRGERIRATASSSTIESIPPDTASTRRRRRDRSRCTELTISDGRGGMSRSYRPLTQSKRPSSAAHVRLPSGLTSAGAPEGGNARTTGYALDRPRARRLLYSANLGEPRAGTHAHSPVPPAPDLDSGCHGEAEGEVATPSSGTGLGNREAHGALPDSRSSFQGSRQSRATRWCRLSRPSPLAP